MNYEHEFFLFFKFSLQTMIGGQYLVGLTNGTYECMLYGYILYVKKFD